MDVGLRGALFSKRQLIVHADAARGPPAAQTFTATAAV